MAFPRSPGATPMAVAALRVGVGLVLVALLAAAPEAARAHGQGQGPPGFECEEGPFGLPGVTGPQAQIGEWGPVLTWPFQATHSLLMHTGKVLAWRGREDPIPTTGWVFDPISGSMTSYQTASSELFCASPSSLADGRVLVVGGCADPDVCRTQAIIFEPTTESWSPLSLPTYGRWYATSTVLPDGRVLVMGGQSQQSDDDPILLVEPSEVYDPGTDTWTLLDDPAGLYLWDPNYPRNFVLPSGKILYTHATKTRLFDVDAQTWTFRTNSLYTHKEGSHAMYLPGKVIKQGGNEPAIPNAETYDGTAPGNPQWVETAQVPVYPRRRQDLVLLPDGTLLSVGGSVSQAATPECAVHAPELWNPVADTWTTLASHQMPRVYHSTALLLPDGRVISMGGEDIHVGPFGEPGQETAEIFSPPYLFKGPRPTVTTAPSAVGYAEVFQVETPSPSSIASVAFMRPGAVTHNFDQDQRYVPLDFTPGATDLSVTSPPNANFAPPGYYMLFLVDTNGVPSVARFVQVGTQCVSGTDADADGVDDCVDNCLGVSNPTQVDTDSDGAGNECDPDDDNDGLTDVQEAGLGTNPLLLDTDGDALSDGDEVNTHGTDPLLADTDTDGLDDGEELNTHGTDPLVADTDTDGLNDGDEINLYGTDPLVTDSDSDGLDDGDEVNLYGTEPTDPDSDNDGLLDGAEVDTHGTDPLLADTDADGLSDGDEINVYGTLALVVDTDGDTYSDGDEVAAGSDPLDPESMPAGEPPLPAPALSTWSIGFLAGILTGAALWRAQRRRRSA